MLVEDLNFFFGGVQFCCCLLVEARTCLGLCLVCLSEGHGLPQGLCFFKFSPTSNLFWGRFSSFASSFSPIVFNSCLLLSGLRVRWQSASEKEYPYWDSVLLWNLSFSRQLCSLCTSGCVSLLEQPPLTQFLFLSSAFSLLSTLLRYSERRKKSSNLLMSIYIVEGSDLTKLSYHQQVFEFSVG